jgi:hypothetical protein
LQISQGYIIRILQHFATKHWNITNFVMLFRAMMEFCLDLLRSKFWLIGEWSIQFRKNAFIISQSHSSNFALYRSFSSDVTAAILVYQNNEMAAILVYGTGISSFLFKYFVLFHHPTGATDHVSENDLYDYRDVKVQQLDDTCET